MGPQIAWVQLSRYQEFDHFEGLEGRANRLRLQLAINARSGSNLNMCTEK